MRSIKQIERKISVNGMLVGRWYRLISKSGFEYIFKFKGLSGDGSIKKYHSYCLNFHVYGTNGRNLCKIMDVNDIFRVNRVEVLKYFNID